MPAELPKAYQPTDVEAGISALWESSGAFAPIADPNAEPYCIVLPPPNRTGTLHMGHACMLAVEDTLIRYHRMLGKRALWIPGTDHAAIATQTKVEQLLIKQGMTDPRTELGREKFLEKVLEFAERSAATIRHQVKMMGSSCDWSHECYTLDADRNKAVNTMFKMMYDDGIIERGDRLVNWDPKNKTVISDDEIVWVEEKAPFYTFTYGPFQIGTSRPETKFGDKYVVMHPEDERYAQFAHGQKIELEWINGPITATVIKDAVIDREFGTGVMTITPWHDAIDYDLAERHGLDKEQIIGMDGKLLPIAGEFAGQTVVEARKNVVEKLAQKGLLVSVDENYIHRIATAERGGATIEPQISRQWFVRVNKPFALRQNTLGTWKRGEKVTLKELMIAAVESGSTKIVPERFDKVYFHWINNLRDWCISRQIWFGHRIPVWYKGEQIEVSAISPGEGWVQDPDTLDTWFSSGMWTFSTLGWPEAASVDADGNIVKTGNLGIYHPTAVLETGYDILFFWVARMILMSTYALGEVPFKDVYLHGLVRDEQGRKMSKSLDNILDPLDLIPKYGTDAVRLSLIIGSTPGQDTKLSEAKIEGLKHFTNKLWNISRFVIGKVGETEWLTQEKSASEVLPYAKTLADRWILSELQKVAQVQNDAFASYRLSQAADALSEFTWTVFADWYIEIAKTEGEKTEILAYVLRNLLKLWHPFMPFVTEAIWQNAAMGGNLISASYPSIASLEMTDEALQTINQLRSLVTDGRRLRAEAKIDATKKLSYQLVSTDVIWNSVQTNNTWIARLLGASSLDRSESFSADIVSTPSGSSLIGIVQEAATGDEKVRLQAELDEAEKYLENLKQRLLNKEFVAKAPEKVIKDIENKLTETQVKIDRLTAQIGS